MTSRHWRTPAALLAAGALGVAALAAGRVRAEDAPKGEKPGDGGLAQLASKIQEIVLPNGLRLLVLERHDAPVVAFATAVNVGSTDEVTGQTGLAHVFEHMAFKGSSTVGTTDGAKEKAALDVVETAFHAYHRARIDGKPKAEVEKLKKAFDDAQAEAEKFVVPDEFSVIIQRNGGAGLNAFTSADQTVYHVELPSNRLELWFELESERFRDPVLRQFYKEKGAVEEERRMRTESNPMGKLFEEFLSCAFRAHPYGRPVIGHMSDLAALSAGTARKFFERHYAPNNVTIAIVGDATAAQVKALAEKYFGPMPHGPEIEPLPTVETPQKGERRVELEASAQPVLILGWHVPSARNPDLLAVDALGDVLATGRTSRLYRSLVVEKKIAVAAQAGIGQPGQKYPNLFIAFAVPAPGKTTDDCVKAIDEELAKVREELVTEEELAVVKTRARANFIRGIRGNVGLAQGLAMTQNIEGDWRELFSELGKIERLTREDLRRVAREYLIRSNRVRGEIVKPYPDSARGAKKPAKDAGEKKGD